jgi:NAD-dependent dihydropyrimidine dehydrogenase PreA subunit
MKSKNNRVFSLSFFAVILAMIIFNSCGKYEKTYTVDDSKCAACLECISVCGQHAISLVTSGSTKYVTIDQDKCIGCGKCYNACSYRAISGD